jgi:hypothetical protein
VQAKDLTWNSGCLSASEMLIYLDMRYRFLLLCCLLAGLCSSRAEIDFNRQIRPILSNNCLRCHGPDQDERKGGSKALGGLRLDTFAGATLDHQGTRAVVPGKPEASELLARVMSSDPDERMPPPDAGKPLSAQDAALLKAWIAEGADYAVHWSYQQPAMPSVPAPAALKGWGVNVIDPFVLERLEAKGLNPEKAADRYALIRRLSLDLTGLPPSVEEVDAFVQDQDPKAYEKLIDRLLAHPAYGERWARVWLDLARYADSAGYADDPPRTIWGYRDWVIRAINDNMPFDQFSVEQLAGDLLPEPTDTQLIATAFHRNTLTNSEGGTNDEEFRNAAIVDRVNTTFQVWMGTTMACAQCHTHKYDPITQAEYFQLFAFFNQSEDADRKDESPTVPVWAGSGLQRQETLKQEVVALKEQLKGIDVSKSLSAWEASYQASPDGAVTAGQFVRVTNMGEGKFVHLAEVEVFSDGKNVAVAGKASQSSTDFGGPAKYGNDGNTDGNFEKKSVTHTAAGKDPWWEVDLGASVAVDEVKVWNRVGGGGLEERLKGWKIELLAADRSVVWTDTPATVPKPSMAFAPSGGPPAAIRAILALPVPERTPKHREQLLAWYRGQAPELKAPQAKLVTLEKELAQLKPETTVPIMRDLAANRRRKTQIQIRGNYMALGDEVSEGVPAAFPTLPADAPKNRLTLARWLVSPENPLTARVTVNRFWSQLFGVGLVRTGEDFGMQGEMPTHPELLDLLAVKLVESQWDTKALVRLIVSSATYRQDSVVSDTKREADPFNFALSRGPRFRISAEMIRDQALFVSGLLSPKMYGPSVQPPRPNMGLRAAFGGSTDWQTSPGEDKYRRGLYTSWRRSTPYPSMATFDAPSREVCTVQRTRTNTPLQALVTMNDPVYVEASQGLARRMMLAHTDAREAIAYGFRLCLARPPTEVELNRLLELWKEAQSWYVANPIDAKAMAEDPLGVAPKTLALPDLAAMSVVGNVLLNLDEMFLKK